ncbi:hypothetical protein [Methanimicrococcus stummii]|nr:hypothetical protein [Methanimicrococcus sp. Es2]
MWELPTAAQRRDGSGVAAATRQARASRSDFSKNYQNQIAIF